MWVRKGQEMVPEIQVIQELQARDQGRGKEGVVGRNRQDTHPEPAAHEEPSCDTAREGLASAISYFIP